jgi:hypothetical protein
LRVIDLPERGTLSAEQRHIINGLRRRKTQREIARELHISAPRVNQLKEAALPLMLRADRLNVLWLRCKPQCWAGTTPYFSQCPLSGFVFWATDGHRVIWWKWSGDRLLTKIERQFYREFRAWCREGVGYLYRRRKQPKARRQLLPYQQPSWASACEPSKKKNGRRRTTQCKCIGCWPNLDSSKDYALDHRQRVIIAECLGRPVKRKKDKKEYQDDWNDWKRWKRREPKAWKVKARIGLKREWESLFWPDDDSDKYDYVRPGETTPRPFELGELHSVAVYAKKPSYPERLPWLLARYKFYKPKNGTLNDDGSAAKPVGYGWWSPFLLGEESNDYQRPKQLSQLFVYCALGKVNKRQITRSQINAEITVRPRRYLIRRVDFDSKRRRCAPRPQRERWRFSLKDDALNVFGSLYDERNVNDKAA